MPPPTNDVRDAGPPRTLAEQLRGWPDERLSALIDARPDLGVPAPADSAQLAARATTRASLARALDGLDTLHLETLLAVTQIGPTSAAALRPVLFAEPDAIDRAVARLRALALVWGPGEALRAVTPLTELIGLPAGPEPSAVASLLEEVDEEARALVRHLDASGAVGTVADHRIPAPAAAVTPSAQLLARGLLIPREDRHVVIGWNTRLFLRGGRSTRERIDVAPDFATTEVSADLVDRAAAGAAAEFVRRIDMLLEAWASAPPTALRSGGLAARDLRAATDLLHADLETTAQIIETAAAARLLAVGMNDDLDSAWLPTEVYDTWAGSDPGERWTVVARAWLESSRMISLIGGRDGNRPINALTEGLERPWLAAERRAVLTELTGLEPGQALAAGTGPASLSERLRWRHPRRPAGRAELAATVVAEAARLGLVGRDALAAFARALLEGRDAAAEIEPLLPEPIDEVLIQADLTAVAPGPLERELGHKLGLLADVESRGGATVYRFSATSLRRAFDAGWSTLEVKDFLAGASRTPVPQALGFLVDDVARQFGTLRVGAVEAFVRSDDEVALTALLHHREAASLRLRRIAPTVLVSDVPLGVLLPRLRDLGAAPVVEAADGTARVARPEQFRARAPRERPGEGRDRARQAARATAVVAAVRAGDRTAAARPSRGPATTPADVIALLREAADAEATVLIGYLDNHGTNTERAVRPLEVGGGQLRAFDERADDVRSFAVHRITRAHRLG